jgi:hypothetical protein
MSDKPLSKRSVAKQAKKLASGIWRRVRRAGKQVRQRFTVDQRRPKDVVFVCGCQRAGTTVLLDLLEQSPEAFIYGEGEKPAFRGMRLADDAIVKGVVKRNPARVVVIKPLCDSQWADRLLAEYERSRMIWAYRHFDDQVNSLVRKFTGHAVRMNKIKNRDYEGLDWRVERLSDETLRLIDKYIHPEVSRVNAAAINWYIRTNLYFELRLDENINCQLLKYEHLVLHPEQTACRLFDFVGLPFASAYAGILHPESVSKNVTPDIDPEIRELCEGLLARLNARCETGLLGNAKLATVGASG